MNFRLDSFLMSFLIAFVVCFGSVRKSIPSRSRIAANTITSVCHTMFFENLGNIKMFADDSDFNY